MMLLVDAASGLLSNDSDPESTSLAVVAAENTPNGTLSVSSDGSFLYDPNNGFAGIDSFQYIVSDDVDSLEHYWDLGNGADDLTGGASGTVNGATSISGLVGQGLQFDETNDYVEIPDVSYAADFTLEFQFRVDDNSGSEFQYIYSHDNSTTSSSLNIYLIESGNATDPNVIKTALHDGNDATGVTAANALNVNVSALIGDSQWHTYSLVVESGVGAKVYIDGVEMASSTQGADGLDASGSIFVGTRNDLNSARFYGGDLNALQLFGRAKTPVELADNQNHFAASTATIDVAAAGDPTAYDNVFGVAQGGVINVGLDQGLLYNDSDPDNDPLTATGVTTLPTFGTVVLNTDGTFTYTHDGSATTSDSFEYEVSDGNGGFDTATVYLHIDTTGVVQTGEFLVNQNSTSGIQQSGDGSTNFSESAIAIQANGDYVVVWTDFSIVR